MLRTNLATRPFYNERLVQWIVGAAAALLLLFTAFNVSEYLRLSGRQGGLAADAARDEAAAQALAAKAADARRRIDAKSLQRISAQALEANTIIDARTFSWTALFDDIEATLPPAVMLTSITPKVDEDGAKISVVVVGKTVEAIDTFIERLEATGRFKGVQAATEVVTDDGSFETLLNARYTAPSAAPATSPAATPAPPAGPGRQGAR